MYTFYKTVTPEYAKKTLKDKRPLSELVENAKDDSLCDVCQANKVWRFAGTGLCFTCTTGETDASEDFELTLITP